MITQIVIVKKDRHANLDSFPFRYGFSEAQDYELSIQYSSKPIVQNSGPQQRLRINHAKFTNPITGKTEEGNFVLARDADEHHYSVVTVIRSDKNVDKSLSEVLKLFRKHKYVTVEDLISYFHPLYIKGKIKTHNDLKKYLIKLNSGNQQKINEIEIVLKEAYSKIGDLELAKNKMHFKIYDDYANSDEYSRDRAVAFGWGEIYDEAKEYSDAAFNEYLDENIDQIQKLEDKAGFKPMFYSWTKIEDFVREENPELSNIEFDEIMDGFRAHEKLVNMHLIDRLNKSKSDSLKKNNKSNKSNSKDQDINSWLSESELKALEKWQENYENLLRFETTTRIETDKK